jgi:uncharacterized protein (DUF58 family)
VAQFPRYLTPPMLAKLRGLQLRPRHVVEGTVAGLHRSPWRGFSIEFAEHREYAPGDDLRHLDWKVLGRTDKYYLKQYEDETNLLCYLIVDASESMTYQGPKSSLSKLDYAKQLAGLLAHVVLGQKDGVGLATFDTKVRSFVRPGGSALQWEQILSALETPPGEKKTNAGAVFHELAERCSKRGVVVILTDGFDNIKNMLAGLNHFAYRRHDVALLHVLDPAELTFPFQGGTEFVGLEAFPAVQADANALRRAYLQEFETYLRNFSAACHGLGIEYRRTPTNVAAETCLAAWLAERMSRGSS